MQGSKRLRGKSWELTVSGGFDVNGKRIRETKTLKPYYDSQKKKLVPLSSGEADKELRKFIEEVTGPGYAGRMTVKEYLEYWYKTFIDPEKVPEGMKSYANKTKESYKMNMDIYLIPEFGHILLRDLTAHHIKLGFNHIAADNPQLKKISVEGIFRVFRAALELAVGTYIDYNPAKLKAAKPPRTKKREILNSHRVLDLEEAVKLLQVAQEKWLKAPVWDEYKRLVIYACYTTALLQGLRRGELIGLTWDRVDLVNNVIKVEEQISENDIGVVKTDASYRHIRMANMVNEVLKELKYYQAMVKQQRQKDKLEWHDDNLVFTLNDGRPLDGRSLNRWYFKHDLKDANLPMIRFHDLRGSTATLLYELGEVDKVQNILGHAAPQVAHEHYIHKQVKHQNEAIAKLEEAFQNKLNNKTAEN